MPFEEVNAVLGKGGGKATTFPTVGTRREGIIRDGSEQNVTNQAGEIQYQKDGVTPQKQLVIEWDSNEFDAEDPTDTGARKLYMKWRARKALEDAVYAATGKYELEEGAKVSVTFTGEEKVPGSAFKAKTYDVTYEPPTKKFDLGGDPKPVQPELDAPATSEEPPADKLALANTLAAANTDVDMIAAATGISVEYLKRNVMPI